VDSALFRNFKLLENTTFRKLNLFPSTGEWRETPTLLGPLETANLQWLRLALSRWPNTVGVSLPSPEDRNRPSFRNVVFSSNLELRTMDKDHKSGDSEHYTPSSVPFRSFRHCFIFVYRRCVRSAVVLTRQNIISHPFLRQNLHLWQPHVWLQSIQFIVSVCALLSAL
jgi:hypothetical protein